MRASSVAWLCASTWAAFAAAAPQAASTSTSSAAGPAQTIIITAGETLFQFEPHVVTANVGDIIQWNFFPLNHSVVRSAYGFPCEPIDDTSSTEPLFASPIFTQNVTQHPQPYYQVRVNDTAPIWYYCSTIGSCNTKGMVGVINPAPGQTWEYQSNLALQAPYVLQPGQTAPSEAGSSPSSTPAPSSSSGLSTGAIAGIVVGSILGLLLIGALFFFVGRSKTYSDMLHGTRTHKKPSAPAPLAPAAFAPGPEMGPYQQQHDDWKGPHSALTSPAFPPPYASPLGPQATYNTAQYPMNMQGQYHDNSQYNNLQTPTTSRFSELGPGRSQQERGVHELDSPLVSPPLVSPMKFDDGEMMYRK